MTNARAPQIGEPAPDFELPTDSGEPLRLSDLRGRRVILYFYPRDDTSGCTKQACGFRDAYPQIEAEDAVVLGVSPDSAASHRSFKDKYNLPFTLLVDEDNAVAKRYGAWGEKQMYGKTYEGVIRSHYVIDADGTIVDRQLNVSPSNSVERALESVGVEA